MIVALMSGKLVRSPELRRSLLGKRSWIAEFQVEAGPRALLVEIVCISPEEGARLMRISVGDLMGVHGKLEWLPPTAGKLDLVAEAPHSGRWQVVAETVIIAKQEMRR